MKPPYIAVIASLGAHYVRNAFCGIADYVRLRAGGFEVVVQTSLAWQERKPAGVIALINNKKMFRALRDSRLPVVNIGTHSLDNNFPTVISDAREIGRLAAQHLLDAGFDHFGYYGVTGEPVHFQRAQGFIQTLKAKGKQCESCFSAPELNHQYLLHEHGQLKQWIARLPKPVGIFCGSDWRAWFVYNACKETGTRIPCDAALVGADNDALHCENYVPPLSSVDTDARRIGYEAAALLFRLLDGKSAPSRPVLIPPLGLIPRQSSDVFIGSDPHISTVVRYIRRHVDDSLKVSQLLKLVPLSRRVLEQRFHQRLGWSMRAEIHRCKIERVKQLLLGTNLPMEVIADEKGFSSLSHMSRLFRKQTGLTLREYRNKARY